GRRVGAGRVGWRSGGWTAVTAWPRRGRERRGRSLAGRGGSGGCACEAADTFEGADEVGEEWVACGEAQDEASAAAPDGGGDGDEAEAQSLGVADALSFGQGEQFQPAEQVVGEQDDEQVGRVGVEAAAGEVVEPEAELRFFDPVLDVRLRAMPRFEFVGRALLVIADERPVVPLLPFERELLSGLDRVAADDEPAARAPGLRPPAEAGHLAALPVAGWAPVAGGDLADPRLDRGDQGRADAIGDPLALQLGEEVLAPEALVRAQEDAHADRQPTQALGEETLRPGRRGSVSVSELAVQPLAGLGDEAEQR